MQGRLTLVAVAAILPLVLLFAGTAYLDYRSEREQVGRAQLEVSRSMAATVERELRGATASLQALALSPALQQGDFALFRALALDFIRTAPAGSNIVVLDRTGQQYVNTNHPAGEKLLRRPPATNEMLTAQVFATGQPLISNVFRKASGKGMAVTAEVPVFKDGAVIYDLALLLPDTRFRDILASQHLPPGTIASVFDRNGVHVTRVPSAEQFAGVPAVPDLRGPLLSHAEGVSPVMTRDGFAVLAAFSHSEPSGWSVMVGVPETTLRAPLVHSLQATVGVGLVALLISSLVAALLAQRILRPIRALTAFAASPVPEPKDSFGLRELDEVAAALRHGVRERLAAIQALQTLNDSLEARIRQETASRVQAQEQLAQAQRMEALGQLAGGIAHDFNNVLQAVTCGLSLIQRRAEDPEAVRRLAGMASDAAVRGASITGRLLTFARRSDLDGVPIDPRELLQSLREMLAHTLGPGIEVQVEVAGDVPRLVADKAQLETVLINLAVNARDAMKQGGTVVLSAEVEHVHNRNGQAPLPPTGDYVRLTIADTGTGMTPEILSRASEPFFTTKEPGQGTGLGLAMARGFAQQSGGGFMLESAPGAGTVVTLWFPQYTGAEVSARPVQRANAPPTEPPFGTRMRVMLVDDDSMVREILAGELEIHDFVVTTASDGLAALALLDVGQPADVLVTDYAMPGMNGLALIGEARKRRPDLPALLLTGYAEADAEAALERAHDRLTQIMRKPVGGEELARQVAGLRRRPPVAVVV